MFSFFMILRPPRSTLFPYTTLFRSTAAGARVAGFPIFLVQQDAERDGKRVVPELPEAVGELLDARFVTDRRVAVRGGRGRLRGIRPAPPVHVIQVFGLRVIRFEVLVAERPRGRDPPVVADLAELFPAQP